MPPYCSQDSCDSCPERVICRCLQVTESEILEAIASNDLETIREVREHTSAGTGCTCCFTEIREILQRVSLTVCV